MVARLVLVLNFRFYFDHPVSRCCLRVGNKRGFLIATYVASLANHGARCASNNARGLYEREL